MIDGERFNTLQARLVELWPTLTTRTTPFDRTIVVIHSVGFELPAHIQFVIPSYEERFLCAILALLRQPQGRVIYVTSQPMLPRLVDYFFNLAPGLHTADLRRRLTLVSVGDGTAKPLTDKLLARPRLLERIRALVPNPERAVILPFHTGWGEVELALRLGIPVYGSHPSLASLGTKTGSRRVFVEEDVSLPRGVEDVGTVDDLIEAIREIREAEPGLDEVIVKLNDSAGGLGNGLVRLTGAEDTAEIERRVRAIEPDDDNQDAEMFFDALAKQRGIVEARIKGRDFRSPSVQLRASPLGDVEILSTHDQILGGANGLTYLGCRFPADPSYSRLIAAEGLKIGRSLARMGAVGRFSIDFVAVHGHDDAWKTYAIEVNLRQGGTTHPMLTLSSLTDGQYEPHEGLLRNPAGTPKFYVASDHVESPDYTRLTPDDVIDLAETELGWDEDRQAGVAFHMVSAIAGAGRTGVTAIGDSPSEADALYANVVAVLDRTAAAAH